MLPYKGKVGETILKSLRNTLKSVIPANNTRKIIFTGTKSASKFNIKDKIRKEHKHDLIYKAQCPNINCDETYIGNIEWRFSERIIDHSGSDDKSHLYEHAEKTSHENMNIIILKFCRMAIETTNSKENLQRHYILNMKDLL